MRSLATLAIVIALSLQACAARQRQTAEPPPAPPPADAPAVTAAPAPAAAPATPQASNTWMAARVVQVSLSEDDDAASAAIQELIGTEVAAEILAKHGVKEYVNRAVIVRAEPLENEDAINVKVIVDLSYAAPNSPRVAREIADDLVKSLRQRLLREAQGTLASQAARIEEEHADAETELAKTRVQLTELQTKVREATGRSSVSAERFRDELSNLEDARQEIQLELESRAARMKALTDNIAQLTAKVEEQVKNDPVIVELQKVVDAREAKAQRIKQGLGAGVYSEPEYQQALEEVAEARARLLERRSHTADSAGGDAMRGWNREIMSLSVDTAELGAKLDRLNARLAGYQKVIDDFDELESLHERRRHADERLHESTEHLREMQRALSRIRPPRSTVLESNDQAGQISGASRQNYENAMKELEAGAKPNP